MDFQPLTFPVGDLRASHVPRRCAAVASGPAMNVGVDPREFGHARAQSYLADASHVPGRLIMTGSPHPDLRTRRWSILLTRDATGNLP
jgi:hypothetical protein